MVVPDNNAAKVNSYTIWNEGNFTPSNYYLASNPSGYITSSALSGYATQSWVGSNYQPLENQRLSMSNSPAFQDLTLANGALYLTATYPQINFITNSDNKIRILFSNATDNL